MRDATQRERIKIAELIEQHGLDRAAEELKLSHAELDALCQQLELLSGRDIRYWAAVGRQDRSQPIKVKKPEVMPIRKRKCKLPLLQMSDREKAIQYLREHPNCRKEELAERCFRRSYTSLKPVLMGWGGLKQLQEEAGQRQVLIAEAAGVTKEAISALLQEHPSWSGVDVTKHFGVSRTVLEDTMHRYETGLRQIRGELGLKEPRRNLQGVGI